MGAGPEQYAGKLRMTHNPAQARWPGAHHHQQEGQQDDGHCQVLQGGQGGVDVLGNTAAPAQHDKGNRPQHQQRKESLVGAVAKFAYQSGAQAGGQRLDQVQARKEQHAQCQ